MNKAVRVVRGTHPTVEEAVWQRRFWEHEIRSEEDFLRHMEYIHYNPVKHGLVQAPQGWVYSSFRRYMREGVYEPGWGASGEMNFAAGVGAE